MDDLELIKKYRLPRRFIQILSTEVESRPPEVLSLYDIIYRSYAEVMMSREVEESGMEAQQDVGDEFDVGELYNIAGSYDWSGEGLDLEDIIMTYWQVFKSINPKLSEADFYDDYSLFYEQDNIKPPPAEIESAFIDYYNKWSNRIQAEYSTEVERLQQSEKEDQFDVSILERIPITYRSAEYECYINALDEIEVHNSVKLNDNVIFVKADQKYKVYKYLDSSDIEMIKDEAINDYKVVIIVKIDNKLFSIKGDFNRMKVRLPYDMIDSLAEVIRDSMPSWKFSQSKYTIEMILTNQKIDDNVFVHCITNDKRVNNVFYSNEYSNPYAFKNILYFIHRLSSVENTIRTYKANITEILPYGDNGVRVEKGQYYTLIGISDVSDKQQQDTVMADIIKTLAYVERKTQEISSLYDTMIPYKVFDKSQDGGVRHRREKSDSRLSALKASKVGELFTGGYSKVCQSPQQPIIIDEDEVAEWESQEFEYRKVIYNRQVLEFPKDDPLLFICPDDTHPFPGLIQNKDGRMSVCCYKTDQINNPGSVYNSYMSGRERLTPSERRESGLRTSTSYLISGKIADVGRYGDVPLIVNDTLKIVIKEPIYRMGVPLSELSLVHCMLIAVGDKVYLNSTSDSVKNKIASGKFQEMKSMIHIGKQEIIGTERLSKTGADPLAWYHVAEELFDVNIVIATPNGFSAGNYVGFPILPPRPDRKTVIVYRHDPISSENETPQVELVKRLNSSIFDVEVAQYVYKTLIETNELMTVDINPLHTMRLNYYHRIDTRKIFEGANAQIIDGNGKTQAFLYKGITLFIPPTQPLKLPEMSIDETTTPHINYVIETIGSPVSYSIVGNEVVGLFYSIADTVEGIFVPLKPVKVDKYYTPKAISQPIWLPQDKTSYIETYDDLLISLENLWSMLTWCCYRSKLNIEQFMKRYTVIEDAKVPSFGDNVRIKTDMRGPFEYMIRSLNIEFKNAMKDEKFMIPDKQSFEKLTLRLKRYMKSIEGLDIEPPIFISISKSKLRYQLGGMYGDIALLSKIEFNNWLYDKVNSEPRVVRKLEQKMSNNAEPFIYVHKGTDNVFIIQNVKGGSIEKAVNVSMTWNSDKYNLGYNADDWFEEIETPLVVVGINSNGIITVIQNENNVEFLDTNCIILIQYTGSNVFGSVLPLN
jgi:hypothetical protein